MVSLLLSRRVVCLLFAAALNYQALAADNKGKKAEPFITEPVSSKQSIRFYKANKQLQADRVLITADKASNQGCNNFLKKVRVFKALQIGSRWCSLYEKKDCAVGSLVPVNSEKQERHTYILTEGQAWFAQSDDERGADVRSWYCGSTLEDGELLLEVQLVQREVARLTSERVLAQKKLAKAQANFDQAKKDVKESKSYRNRVREEAISTGVIEEEPVEAEGLENTEATQNKAITE